MITDRIGLHSVLLPIIDQGRGRSRGHTWNVYSWPWVSLIVLYNPQLENVTRADFENLLYDLGQSEKR